MLWICLSLLLVSYVVALPLCVWLTRAGRRLGLMDRAGAEAHKADPRVIPNTGGMAIFWAVIGPMLVGLMLVWLMPTGAWARLLPPIVPYLAGLRRVTGMGGGIVAAAGIVHLSGILDDRDPIPWPIKLAAHTAAAAFLVLACDMRVLVLLDAMGPAGMAASAALSIAWIVVVTNAFNFLDNMDGLSAGVAAVVAAVYLAATLVGGQWFVAALTALLLGALLGFLALNFPPARLFMGDGGSLVVGLIVAVISVRTTYLGADVWGWTGLGQPPAHSLARGLTGGPGRWYGVLMPLMVLAVPLYDFTSVTLIRLRAGVSPFTGDRNHLSHRLIRKGLSPRAAVMLIWLATAATGMAGIMLGTLRGWQAVIAALQAAAVLAMLALLDHRLPTAGPT